MQLAFLHNIKNLISDRNFIIRATTTVIAVPLILWLFLTQSHLTGYVIALVTFLLVAEFSWVTFQAQVSNGKKLILLGVGVFYIIFALTGFYLIYLYKAYLAISLLAITWMSDIGAYFFGRIFGGPKLAPKISPGKTWSGALGGVIFSAVTATLLSYLFLKIPNLSFIILFTLLSIIGQLGDLLESGFKRYCQVKDSSQLIPGHGGFLDRLDSLLLESVFIYLIGLIIGFEVLFNFSIPLWK